MMPPGGEVDLAPNLLRSIQVLGVLNDWRPVDCRLCSRMQQVSYPLRIVLMSITEHEEQPTPNVSASFVI